MVYAGCLCPESVSYTHLAAEHIARQSRRQPISGSLDVQPPLLPTGDAKDITASLQSAMSRCAAFQRNAEEMAALEKQIAAHMESVAQMCIRDRL